MWNALAWTLQLGLTVGRSTPDTREELVMKLKVIVSILIAAAPVLSYAAENPANAKLLKQCESAQGEVKKECEEVAKQMMKSTPADKRTDKTGQDITHSGPAMEAEPAAAKPKPATNKEKPTKPEGL
jgi:hypothetical protein